MKLLTISLAYLFLVGCNLQSTTPMKIDAATPGVDTKSQPTGSADVPYISADQITYKLVSDLVLTKKCVMCHSEAAGNKGHVNLETYKNVFDARADIRAEVFNRTMPPKRMANLALSDSQVQFILDWIDNGAKETVESGDITTPPVLTPPDTGEFYFADIQAQVLQTNCTQCHSEKGGNPAGVNLETYENLMKNIDDVKSDIKSGDMPPKRGTALTDVQKAMILTWIENGAKEKQGSVVTPPVVTPPVVQPPFDPNAPIYFDEVNEKVFKTNCAGCHSGAAGGGLSGLTNYKQVSDWIDEVNDAVTNDVMPPERAKQLTPEQKALLLKWISNGAPEKAP